MGTGDQNEGLAELEREATSLRRCGERERLLELISGQPHATLRDRPRLCFEAGMAAIQLDNVRFTRWFELAYAGFVREGNAEGAALTAAAATRATISDFSNMRSLDRWASRLRDAIEAGVQP